MKVVLHQFVLDWDLPNPSPFCLKVETWLRMMDLAYTVEPWTPMGAPLGKAPYVIVDGETISDSSTILRVLSGRLPTDPDAVHRPADLARAHAIERMLEEHTYFGILVLRWLQDEPWEAYREVIGGVFPAPLRRPLTWWLRRGVRRAVWNQGLGRHSLDEVVYRMREDLAAIENQLDGPFLLGDHPCRHDASAYAFLELCRHPLGTEGLAPAFDDGTNLRDYVDHMRAHVWPEWMPR